ncbi:MAG: DUF4389 domain-containing protein [Acidimicrobiales bacterium]
MFAPIAMETSSPVEVRFGSPSRQRRLTVLFRLVLVIPQSIVLFFLSLAAMVVLVIAWFGALVTGRVPGFAAEFLVGYLRWTTRVLAYEYLLTDRYPPFSLEPSPDFPIDLMVRTGPMNRWAILLRYFLAIPGSIAAGLVTFGMYVFGIVTWITTLARGTTPQPIFEANAAAIRYVTRFNAYFTMVTSFYPADVLGDGEHRSEYPSSPDPVPPPSPSTSPLAPLIDPAFGTPASRPSSSLPTLGGYTPPPPKPAPPPPTPSAHRASSVPELVSATPSTPYREYVPPLPSEPRAGPDWPLVLSSGARKLVVAFFFLGAIGYLLYFAVAVPTFVGVSRAAARDAAAQNQAMAGYDKIVHSVRSFAFAGASCSGTGVTAPTVIKCLEANDARLATAFTAYAGALSTIGFPPSLKPQASAARSAATRAASTMARISAAGTDPQAYQAAVADANVQAVFSEVDTSFATLNSALIDHMNQ